MRVADIENTGVAGMNSLNSIQNQWNPRILSNTTKEAREPGEPDEPEQSVRPDLFPPFFESRIGGTHYLQSWSRPVLPSRLCFGVFFPHKVLLDNPSRCSFECPPITLFMNYTHHNVLDCGAAAD